ncbi:MAG TPA: APC family permease [Actinoplanes sp.]|nr:APC family permease [Actinoplanes sp.]
MLPPATSPRAGGRIGASALVFLALAAAAPITVAVFGIPAGYARGGRFQPLAFLAVGVILLLFGVGYSAMVRRAPAAGALYAFVTRGLGRPIGVGAASLTLVSYTALQAGLYGVAGLAAAPLLSSSLGVTAPWWAVAAGCWLLVSLGGLLRVDIAAGALVPVVLAEAAVVTGFAAAGLLEPAQAGFTWAALLPGDPVDRSALGLLLVLAAFAFIGFETTAVYARDTGRPRRSITRATLLAVVLLAVLYAGSAWATGVAAGPAAIAGPGPGPELLFDLAAARLAPWAVTLGRVLLLTGLLAAMIALHHTATRYVVALAGERVLPGGLAGPVPAALIQSLVVATVLGVAYAAGWDPVAQTFGWLTTAGALGVLLVLVATALATLLFLNRVPDGESVWRRLVAPAAATILLGALAYLAFTHLPALFGVPAGHPLTFVVPAGYAAVLLVGVAYGYAVKAVRPITYAGIGLGGTAVVVAPAVPKPRGPGAHRPERVGVSRRTPGSEPA